MPKAKPRHDYIIVRELRPEKLGEFEVKKPLVTQHSRVEVWKISEGYWVYSNHFCTWPFDPNEIIYIKGTSGEPIVEGEDTYHFVHWTDVLGMEE